MAVRTFCGARPFRARFPAGPRSGNIAPATLFGSDVVGNPGDPGEVEGAAEVEEMPRRRETHRRKNAGEVRRGLDGGEPLDGAGIGQARTSDTAIGP